MGLANLNELSILISTEPEQLRDKILDQNGGQARFAHIRLADGSTQVFDTKTMTGFFIDSGLSAELDFFANMIFFGFGANTRQIVLYKKIFAGRLPETFVKEVEDLAINAHCDYELIH